MLAFQDQERKKKTTVAFLNRRKKLRRHDSKKAKAHTVFKKPIHFYETSELQKRTDVVQTAAEQSQWQSLLTGHRADKQKEAVVKMGFTF